MATSDLSLGPLRIANPDDVPPDTPLTPRMSNLSIPPVSPLPEPEHHVPSDHIPKLSTQSQSQNQTQSQNNSPVSPLDSDPPSPTQGPYQSTVQPPYTAPRTDSFETRQRQRQSMPNSYLDKQQMQYSQYPSATAQNNPDPHTHPGRPSSTYYPQMGPSGNINNGIARHSSYRVRGEASRSLATPSRSDSKDARMGTVAGVPSRDDGHSERLYQPQYAPGNGPVPPRRTSRGVGSGRMGSMPTNAHPSLSNTPIAGQTPLSGSPYAVGGGPLSSSEEWQERGAAVATRQDYDVNGRPVLRSIKKSVKDFNFGQTLGEGSYSTVLAAQDRQSLKDYAIKILDKKHIIKEKKVKYVNIERNTLNRLTDHPGVVRLYYTFQDERSLYFVLDLCSGGELLGVLKRMTTFDEECTRFYGAQILDTIEYMHGRGVLHRDLKPENVLLDDQKHIKITDFGTAKLLSPIKDGSENSSCQPDATFEDDRANSFVGTAEYVSPELLTDKSACKASDLWAFGCIIYQLLAGRPPFKAANEYLTFQKIVALEYEFPRGFPPVARDLVERLLVLDPQRRLSIEHIKNHQFFHGIQWGRGLWQQKAPRLKSYVPPATPPIKLNGFSGAESYPPDISGLHSTHPTILPPNNNSHPLNGPKPQPRVITELPPPSQLDIEWSPVLTRSNERILKLGNLSVQSTPNPHSPHNGDGGGKLSRLFGGSNNKKRQRLVMVTSSARIIIAPAGGEEKKSKSEIGLLSPGTELSSSTDAKGVTHWTVNTRDRHFVFEDVKPPTHEPMASAISTQEWLDAIDRAKELALAQAANHAYSADDGFNMPSSVLSGHSNGHDHGTDLSPNSSSHSGRGTIHKQLPPESADSLKGRRRFSKRQSKGGLTAVF